MSRPFLSAALLAWSKVLVRTDCMVEMVLTRDSLMFPPVMVSQAVPGTSVPHHVVADVDQVGVDGLEVGHQAGQLGQETPGPRSW